MGTEISFADIHSFMNHIGKSHQGCGNIKIFYLSMDKYMIKNYLSEYFFTCPYKLHIQNPFWQLSYLKVGRTVYQRSRDMTDTCYNMRHAWHWLCYLPKPSKIYKPMLLKLMFPFLFLCVIGFWPSFSCTNVCTPVWFVVYRIAAPFWELIRFTKWSISRKWLF